MNAGTGCLNCSEVQNPPAEFIVTFSTVSECACATFGGFDYSIVLNTLLNGAHTLTKGAGCSWQKTIASGATIQGCDAGSNCATNCDSGTTLDYTITLSKNATEWELSVLTDSFQVSLFEDSQLADTYGGGGQNCMSFSGTFENRNTGLSGPPSYQCGDSSNIYAKPIMATGGTATIVCV